MKPIDESVSLKQQVSKREEGIQEESERFCCFQLVWNQSMRN